MAATARKKWALILGAFVLLISLILVFGLMGPHRYAFIDQFGGKRDLEVERDVLGVAEGMGGVPHNEIVLRCYTFKAPADKVLAAMTKELTRDGWVVAERDSVGGVYFGRGSGEMAIFDRYDNEVSCTVTIGRRRSSWLLDQWEALKERLGIQ